MPNHSWCEYWKDGIKIDTLRTADDWQHVGMAGFRDDETSGYIWLFEREQEKPSKFTAVECQSCERWVGMAVVAKVQGLDNYSASSDSMNKQAEQKDLSRGVIFKLLIRVSIEELLETIGIETVHERDDHASPA